MNMKEVSKRHALVESWGTQATEIYESLDEEQRKKIKELCAEYTKTNSKTRAIEIAGEIADILGLSHPFNYCVDQTWDGWFGYDYVASRTFLKLLTRD